MITTCTGCQMRYRLEDSKVPQRLVRVRCPQCQTVFLLDGTQTGAQVDQVEQPQAMPPPDNSLGLERSGEVFALGAEEGMKTLPGIDQTVTPTPPSPPPAAEPQVNLTPPAPPAVETRGAAAATTEPTQGGTALAVDEEKPRRARGRDKARMLARALVSDILVYNRESRDKALQEGNLLEALGPEIKKSWELYKEKVTPEVANNTTHFRDALNEILAEGQKIF